MQPLKVRRCGDCKKFIPFRIFLRDNPTISVQRAQDFWDDPYILLLCPECFLKSPEKPYKRRRRYFHNDRLKLRL
ncbi:MAG: hypothetical protein ACXAAI_10570 [Promethearchaeota archaeon]